MGDLRDYSQKSMQSTRSFYSFMNTFGRAAEPVSCAARPRKKGSTTAPKVWSLAVFVHELHRRIVLN